MPSAPPPPPGMGGAPAPRPYYPDAPAAPPQPPAPVQAAAPATPPPIQMDSPAAEPPVDPDGRMARLRKAISWYIEAGFTVTPVHYPIPDQQRCSCGKLFADDPHAGKHPVRRNFAIQFGYTDAAQALTEWDEHPWNIGIVVGVKGGIDTHTVAFDIDPRNGGLASFERIKTQLTDWDITDTLSYSTSGGGFHLIYRLPEDDNTLLYQAMKRLEKDIAPGVEFKYTNGLVVAAPSIHHTGTTYELINAVPPTVMDRSKLDELIRIIKGPQAAPAPTYMRADSQSHSYQDLYASTGTEHSSDTVAEESRDNPGYFSRVLEHILINGTAPVTFGPGDHHDPLKALFGAIAKFCFAYPPFADECREHLERSENWIPAIYGSICADVDLLVTKPEPWQKTDQENFVGIMRYCMRQELYRSY